MEKRFLIKWEIDEYAETPLKAIHKAIAAMPHSMNFDTLATVFTVEEFDINSNKVIATHEIDLFDKDGLPFEENMFTIEGFGTEYQCRNFFDIDTNSSGIEVYEDGKRLGSMIGVSIPDSEDLEEIAKFKDELENWIVVNGF